MSQLLSLYDYWDSYKKGSANQELANQIKVELQEHNRHIAPVLSFIASIVHQGNYSEEALQDAVNIYDNLGLEEVEECALSKEKFKEFIEKVSKFNLDETQYLINASTIWDIFKDVDDENPLKVSIMHYVLDNIITLNLYDNVEIINTYINYVHNHDRRVISLPLEMARLLY